MHFRKGYVFAGRYQLEVCLGSGGFGEVWRAKDNMTGCEVAIKIHLKGNGESAARAIVHEYTRVMTIHHDNLLTPSHVDMADGDIPFLVMELCEGDLKDRDLTEHEIWQLIRDVSSGLKRLAENKKKRQRSDGTYVEVPDPIIHQDIKPANILLRSNGMYAISDFGISKRRLSTLSTNVQGGSEEMDSGMTVDYAAPERFPRGKGVAVQASDIWSLGAMLYELVEGHRPFAECGGDCLNPTIGLPIPAITREGYSDELKQLVYDCMAREPERRPTAAQLKEYSEHVIKGEPRRRQWLGVSQPGREKQPSSPKPTPKPWKKWLYASVAVVVVVLVALWIRNRMEGGEGSDVYSLSREEVVAAGPEALCEEAESPADTIAVLAVEEEAPPANPQKRETATAKGVRLDGNTLRFEVDGTEYSYRMVYVSGGTYQMGAQKTSASSPNYDPDADDDEGPVHNVTVGSFYMGKTEVTQALWKAVMGGNPSKRKGNDLPVESVSYDDVQEFIRELNELTGVSFRLPTEEEWEYAARGGSSSRGYKYSGSDDIGSVAWYFDDNGYKTHPVALKQANEIGLYDMSGNVRELCSSVWRSDYSGARSVSGFVYRGGGWRINDWSCRVSYRNNTNSRERYHYQGFRLVL